MSSPLITAEYFQEQMVTLGLKAAFAPSAYNLEVLILEASEWVEGYTDRKLSQQSVTYVVRGPRRNFSKLIIDDYPVVSVTSVGWEDELGNIGTIDVSRLRILPGGILEWKTSQAYGSQYTGTWYPELVYTVVVVVGYSPVPSNVQRATALKIADLLQPQYQGPQDRQIFMVTNIQGMIVDLLEPYRRERLG